MSGASSTTASTWTDGFPVVTDWSTDPIIYACQKNFILGIGDVNTHRDGNLPGGTASDLEPSQPPEVSADANAVPPVNVFASTNLVGSMEGQSNLGWRWATGDEGRFYIAGLAYDAHLPIDGKGVRKFTDANNLTTISTVSTYWLDVLEYQTYVNNNQYYYATKYGGFTVPSGYTYGGALPADSWYNSTNTLGSNKQPDNYFTASNAALMQSGAFDRHLRHVAAELRRRRTALLDGLREHCSPHLVINDSHAGMHMVGWLPGWTSLQVEALAARAAGHGLGLHPIGPHYRRRPAPQGLLLGYAALSAKQLRAATALLGRCLREIADPTA